MMKNLIVFTINVYQKVLSPLLKTALGVTKFCRFSTSCSEYAKISIRKYGLIKGLFKSMIRILSCQPFFIPLRNHFVNLVYTHRSFQNKT